MSKKALFLTTVSFSMRFLTTQAARLQHKGWSVLLASGGDAAELNGHAPTGVSTKIVPMEREISPLADLRSLAELYLLMRSERPTVSNVGTPKAGLLGGMAAALAGVPVRVYTLHGLRLETTSGLRRAILMTTERIAMACAHAVVPVSPSLQRAALDLGLLPAHKSRLLGHGSPTGVPMPDLSAAESEAGGLRTALGLQKDDVVFGFVGRFTRDKGLPELLRAFEAVHRDHPQIKLLLVGDHESGDPLPPEVTMALEAHPNVIFAGMVPDPTPHYLLMHALVLPTHREGFPTVALEAAACGLPLITTDATGATDAVQDGVTGWKVPAGDATALATAMLAALADPAEAKKRGLAGQAWVRANFRPADVAARWEELYEELLLWRELSAQNPAKRLFDVVVSAGALLVLGVPMLGLSLLVRTRLGSPVIFKQVRPGLGGRPFTMYKFRTMTDARGENGELLPDADRLTAFGRWLRSTSLDELPELYNVLKGDMSLVGPRPLLMHYLPHYTAQERRRMHVRPGITGWAQVNGRNTVAWDDRLSMDVWYVDNMSLRLDLKIMAQTVEKVLKKSDVVVNSSDAMPNLDEERMAKRALQASLAP